MPVTQFNPSIRICQLHNKDGSFGFHLSRTQWDPYPWISNVELNSPAHGAGVLVGDCLLEVNGDDIIGLRIADIAEKIKHTEIGVELLLWNAGCSSHVVQDIGPTVKNIQKFSTCLKKAVKLLECPVCMENISPPAYQCYNGHLICGDCRPRTEKCPICRVLLGPRGRCLLAEKLNNLLTETLRVEERTNLENLSPPSLTYKNCKCVLVNDDTKETLKIQRIHDAKESRFHCPAEDCKTLLPTQSSLISHIQLHNSPLIQYFLKAPQLKIHLPRLNSHIVCIKSNKDVMFFLHRERVSDETMAVWLTVLDDEESDKYEYKIQDSCYQLVKSMIFSRKHFLDDELYFVVSTNTIELVLDIVRI